MKILWQFIALNYYYYYYIIKFNASTVAQLPFKKKKKKKKKKGGGKCQCESGRQIIPPYQLTLFIYRYI